MMREKNKIKIKLSIYLLFLVGILFIGLNYEKNIKIADFLEKQKNTHLTIYNNVYNDHKEQANVTYELLINNQQIKDIYALLQNATSEEKDILRDNLYQIIKDKYKILKSFNIRQLHFHLKDNESFLRMHKVKKYGDNLTLIRPTVAFVNKYHKKVDGFEEGRIYNGYRFVFPVKNKNNEHLGSIEISYNANTFVKHIANSYNFSSNILVNKNVVDEKVFNSEKSNYIKSPYKGYYFDKKVLKYKKSTASDFKIDQFGISKNTKNKGLKSINGGKNISLYNNGQIITYVAIKNPITKDIVAFFIIRNQDTFIKNKIVNFNITFSIISLLLLIVFYFLYINSLHRLELKDEVKSKTLSLSNINKELEKNKAKITLMNKNLTYQVKEEVEKNRKQDQQMLEQSRLAQMGEMISMIAHQWRQPLNAISLTSSNLKFKCILDDYEKDLFQKELDLIEDYSQHLSSTIDDFREFFKESKKKEITTLEDIVNSTLNIVKTSVENKNIKIIKDFNCNIKLETYPNEVKQVILNIIKNAEDILLENKVKSPTITISSICTVEHSKYALIIKDNAGGIPEDIINKIFDPYFSTKLEKDGTGLGLYMSKTIIAEHCDGKLSVSNDDEGAVFKIELESIN